MPVLFFIGFMLKQHKIIKKNISTYLLFFVFYFALPALILRSLSSIELNADLFKLPLIATIVISLVGFISFIYIRHKSIDIFTKGVFIVSTMIINTGFVLPYVAMEFGINGLSQLFVFDLANGVIAYTFAFFISAKYSSKTINGFPLLVIKAIPLWALILSLTLSYFEVKLPSWSENFLFVLSETTIPLLIFALGLSFSLKLYKKRYIFIALTFRMLLGLVFGYILCLLFQINGTTQAIILIASSAPAGYNTLVFSSIHDTDTEFASSVVSVSIFIGFVVLLARALIIGMM